MKHAKLHLCTSSSTHQKYDATFFLRLVARDSGDWGTIYKFAKKPVQGTRLELQVWSGTCFLQAAHKISEVASVTFC